MAILLALGAALAWGSSDFAAGYTSRRASAVSVTVLTHLASALALLALVWGGAPTGRDLAWGMAAGLGGGFGAMLLFRGLGRGSMAVVAPITAAGASTIPAVVGVLLGETISTTAAAGIVLAIVAVVLISLVADDAPPAQPFVDVPASGPAGGSVAVRTAPAAATGARAALRRALARPGVSDGLLSGVGFGLFFVCISRASEDAGYWPLFAARALSAVLFALVALRARDTVVPERGARAPVIVAGVLDAAAAALFVASTRVGLLSVGAVLASLYPAATVVLARIVADERIGRRQLAGLAIAGVAVSLLAL